ncbi:M61 family metallopeptidase [bacterium]|nr:M61 family metallopeptidase [bacterium]
MLYTVSYQQPNTHYIDIELEVNEVEESTIQFQLPAWRPGRYELGNFAKNIQRWNAYDTDGNELPSKKLTKDLWEVTTNGAETVIVKYNYFANELNAGSTFLDASQLYINGVNCFLYVPNRMGEVCELQLELPEQYLVACGLKALGGFAFEATDFHELVDCPLIASDTLKKDSYQVGDTTFYLWFQGECQPDFERLKKDFIPFTEKQMELFGGFPTSEYHFLFQILPYRAYHGVEHSNSTVCLLGPSYDVMRKGGMYDELLGVSSHELFHTWNVKRIRPIEMWPYDYAKENYSRLGYLSEGVTTLYGDVMLLRSGVFSEGDYFKTLNQLLDRHFNNPAVSNLSVADSSFDTWLDGYVAGVPNRKTSIYTEGALCTLMLDAKIREATGHQKSFDDVMRIFHEKFYQKGKGISETDYLATINQVSETDLSTFVNQYINGTEDYTPELKRSLSFLGLQYKTLPADAFCEAYLGFKVMENNGALQVVSVYPDSIAELAGLGVNDELITVNGYKAGVDFNQWCDYFKNETIVLGVKQNYGSINEMYLRPTETIYYKKHQAQRLEHATDEQKASFEKWRN